jgi:hypothetical protein|tara:strand:- start:270 stop:512 length:243 start_codon:yes stop_codon:yes gene_type:complete
MEDYMENEFDDFTEFDFLMTALTIYCMTDMTKEQYWTVINHVNDGYEFDTAIDIQAQLNDLVREYNGIRRVIGICNDFKR